MSVIFPPAILGPEMAAPILWAPGIFGLSAGKPPCPQNSSFRGGVVVFLKGEGVEVPILFLWAWGFFRQELAILKTIGFGTFLVPKSHPNGYQNCWCTKIASFDRPQNLRF